MYPPWRCTMHVTPSVTTLLVSDPSQDLLKAKLDSRPRHPRALLTLLEGLSLWQGQPLRVALCVDDSFRDGHDSSLLGDELWPAESALVQFDVVHPVRPRRLDGIGDFRGLRRLARSGSR